MAEVTPLEARGISARYAESTSESRPAGTKGAPPEARLPLAGVDLEVRAGELVAILGPNGAGKTTLLKVLAGTLIPSAGDVRLFGEPLLGMDRRLVAQKLAVVSQTEEIAFGFSVQEVVMMGRAPHQGAWMRATEEDEAIVANVLERCDLGAHAKRPVRELSGGEQKRVMIARALAQRPRVLLLDEPAAFLDVRHQIALYDLLAEEVSRDRLACAVVMHDLNIAAQYASRVVLAKEGKFVAIGGVDEVMTYARLRETFDTDLYAGKNELTNTLFFLPMRTRREGALE